MLGCFGEITKYSFMTPTAQSKFDICYQAKKAWPAWLEYLNHHLPTGETLQIHNGTHVVLNCIGGKLDEENFQETLKAVHRYHEPHELVDVYDIPGMNPHMLSRSLKALYLPEEGRVNAHRLLHSLEWICERHPNISMVDGKVMGLEAYQGKITKARADVTDISAGQILVAAGVDSARIMHTLPELADTVLPVFPGVGVSLLVKSRDLGIESVIRTSNRGFACGLHVMPTEEPGVYYVGATNLVLPGKEQYARMGFVYALMKYVIDQINRAFDHAEVVNIQVGYRPVSLDTYPLLGETSVKGLWSLTGTYRDGIHQSPYICQILAENVLGKRSNSLTGVFHPERDPICMSLETAKATALENYVAGLYEQGTEVPKMCWGTSFESMLRNKVDHLYDNALDLPMVLHPDLLSLADYGDTAITDVRDFMVRKLGQPSKQCTKDQSFEGA